jgi:eukaryotic-like serine/threonine-protein kinase
VAAPRTGLTPWGWAGIAALAVAAIGVIAWRPSPVVLPPPPPPPPAKVAVAKAAPPAAEAAPRVPADPAELQRMAAAKTAAEEQRERYRNARTALEKLPVAAWGGEPWAAAQAADAKAQERYDALDFAAAAAAWAEGTKGIAAVQAARAPALAAALATGRAALAKPDSRAASAAFTQALAIQPGHAVAAAGLKRAQTLDEVVHLVDAARIDEQSGRAAAAEDGFRRALELDGETTAAREGLARLQQAKGEAAFRSALAEGWRLLGNGQRAAAAAAFRRAGALRPGAPEAAEGLAQVSAGERSATLGGLRAQAQAAERAERWAEAEKLYAQALQLEPGLSYATEGAARTAPRARLDAQLQGLIDDPAQALRPSLRQMARLWLEQAAAAAAPSTRLQRQATAAARILAAAERPVPVSIESDGQTQVVLLRVRRLGTLAQQTLELLPGRYVLVGTREGYRDVRREIDVAPDSPPPPVVVSCQERI